MCEIHFLEPWPPAGLPRILVDVRHEASHNELPSLALLRMAAASALTWLKKSYWKQQSKHVDLRLTQILQLLKVRAPDMYFVVQTECKRALCAVLRMFLLGCIRHVCHRMTGRVHSFRDRLKRTDEFA